MCCTNISGSKTAQTNAALKIVGQLNFGQTKVDR